MKTIEELKHFLLTLFPHEKIYLFGSRARGDASEYSDIDIAIKGDRPLRNALAKARFAIEESQIPYKVDLIDLSQTSYLEKDIEKEGIVWH